MRKKEREDLKNEIAYRNMMTKKLGRSMKMFFFIFLYLPLLLIWGFSGLHDNVFNCQCFGTRCVKMDRLSFRNCFRCIDTGVFFKLSKFKKIYIIFDR